MASIRGRIVHAVRREPASSSIQEPAAIAIGNYPEHVPSYTWIRNPRPQDPLPCGAVLGGKLETGQNSYIGKARVGDQEPCGFFTDEDRQLHVPYGCNEHVLKDFDVLVVHDKKALLWQQCAGGNPPAEDVHTPVYAQNSESNFWSRAEDMIVGRTCTPLTDGQTYHGVTLQLSRFASTEQDICRPGKIHRTHGCLYIPYSGREYIFHEHQMLMLKKSPGHLKQICRYVILKSMAPYPTKKSVETLPLPSKLKKFLELPPLG